MLRASGEPHGETLGQRNWGPSWWPTLSSSLPTSKSSSWGPRHHGAETSSPCCPLSELLACRICEHNYFYFILFFATTSWKSWSHSYCNWDSWGEGQEEFRCIFEAQGHISLLSDLLSWGRIPTNNWNWLESTWKLVSLFCKFLQPCFWSHSLEEFLNSF